MNLVEIRASGLLELFVMDELEGQEKQQIVDAITKYPALKADLWEIQQALLQFANAYAISPHPAIKPLLLATVDYSERLQNGEIPDSPMMLHPQSQLADYQQWLDRPDMVAPSDHEAMYAKIIAHESEKLTAIVWLRYGAPDETHTDEYEKFLIVEGSCQITIGDQIHNLQRGDYLSIPLHINHRIKVTSDHPCKVILQRVAA